MIGRVHFKSPGYIWMDINWVELVDNPFREGRVIEAFTSADALIDDSIESCLRQMYNDFECQDLINEIHYLRNRVYFDGLVLLEILKSKGAVDDTFIQKVRRFKKARNLVTHNVKGEYALIIGNPEKKYSSQEELDKQVDKESKVWLSEAYDIFEKLFEISKEIGKNREYYFSEEFYREHPREKIAKKRFPKQTKR